MASQASRGSQGHGRSPRPGSSPARLAADPEATGVASGKPAPKRKDPAPAVATPPPATRAVYRLLLMKGLSAPEAANLTAFICGLPTTDLRWSLKQVNQLLFLRAMKQSGRFGDADGGPKVLH